MFLLFYCKFDCLYRNFLGTIAKCVLCDIPIENISELRLHVISNLHLDAVARVT